MWFASRIRLSPNPLGARKPSPARRLDCEVLEDRTVPSAVVADFPGYGLYRYDTATQAWQLLNQSDPSALAVDAVTGDVAASFAGYGTFEWTPLTGWFELTNASASVLSIANDANGVLNRQFVAGEFNGAGVFLLLTGQNWQQVTPMNATSLGVDGTGDVVGAFGRAGVWWFATQARTVQQLTPAFASQVAFAGNGNVVGEFPGYGVWDYSSFSNTWVQLSGSDVLSLAGGGGSIAASFQGYGTYRYDLAGGGWVHVNAAAATNLTTDGTDIAAVFGNLGIWLYDVSSGRWAQINSAQPGLIGSGD